MRLLALLLLLAVSAARADDAAVNASFDYHADLRLEEGAVNKLIQRHTPKRYDIPMVSAVNGPVGFVVHRIGVDFQVNQMVLDLSVSIYANGIFVKTYDKQIPVSVQYTTVEVDQAKKQVFARINGALDRLERFVTAESMQGKALPGRLEEAAIRVESEFKSIFSRIIMAQLRSDVGLAEQFLVTSRVRLKDYPIYASNGRVSAMMNNAITVNVTYKLEVEAPSVTAQFDPITGVATYLSNCNFTLHSVYVISNNWLGVASPLPRPNDPGWAYFNDEAAYWDANQKKFVLQRSYAEDVVFYFQWLWWNQKYSSPTMPNRSTLAGKSITLSVLASVNGKQFGPFSHLVKL
jgi:hypothetical protein